MYMLSYNYCIKITCASSVDFYLCVIITSCTH